MIRTLTLDHLYFLGFCLYGLGAHLTCLFATSPQEAMNNLRTGSRHESHGKPHPQPTPLTPPRGQLSGQTGDAEGKQQQGSGSTEPGEGAPSRASLPVCADHPPLPWDPSLRRALPGGPWPQEVALRHLLMEEPCEQVTPPQPSITTRANLGLLISHGLLVCNST